MKIIKFAFLFYFGLMANISNAADDIWKLHTVDDIQVARTVNNTGSIVGVLCNTSEDGCVAYIAINSTCDVGESYPMMVNSSVGAIPLVATCTIWGKSKYLVFDDFEGVILAFETGGEIGFAMPMASGQFRVIRFGTIGAIKAIAKARARPKNKTTNKTTNKNLSDQSI